MENGHHLVPTKYYIGVFVALLALTALTVYTAEYVDLGHFNFALAMIIALFKSALVAAIFMGLWWDKTRVNIMAFLTAFFFFFFFVALLLIDYNFRGATDLVERNYDPDQGYAPAIEKVEMRSEGNTNMISLKDLIEMRKSLIDSDSSKSTPK